MSTTNQRLFVLAVAGTAALSACGVDAANRSVSPDDPLAYATAPRVAEPVEFVPFVSSDIRFTTIVARPGDSHLYALDQTGRVLRIDPPTLDDVTSQGSLIGAASGGADLDDVVLDVVDTTITDIEEGLVGLAFTPSGDTAYIHHSRVADGHSVIAEYRVAADGTFDASTRRELFVVEQFGAVHNAGQLLFGPDGLLYLAFGDGSPWTDTNRKALDVGSPLGKILRIDPAPSSDAPYSVPVDNPYVGVDGADPRVWSSGLRNPFSFSFDPATGDMWVADVGEIDFEEVNLSMAVNGRDAGRGVDYGWSAFEADARYNLDQFTPAHQPPRFSYAHADFGECGAVADGTVIRESAIPALDGWYTYGDWCSGLVWARDTLRLDAEPVVLDTLVGFTQMLQTEDGNLYVSSQLGTIALVVPA